MTDQFSLAWTSLFRSCTTMSDYAQAYRHLANFSKSLAGHPRPFADPGRRCDLVVVKRLLFVIDLMPHDDPRILVNHFLRGSGSPMSNGDILDPAQIGHVVHVALFVDVFGRDAE